MTYCVSVETRQRRRRSLLGARKEEQTGYKIGLIQASIACTREDSPEVDEELAGEMERNTRPIVSVSPPAQAQGRRLAAAHSFHLQASFMQGPIHGTTMQAPPAGKHLWISP
jgi:hypothetical protein